MALFSLGSYEGKNANKTRKRQSCWPSKFIIFRKQPQGEDVRYLRNRKHFPCFHTVIETRVEVWENEKLQWEHESASVSITV